MPDVPDHTVPAQAEVTPEPAEEDGGIRPSLGTRLWFGWAGLVALLVTIPLSTIQIVSHLFAPTARNFKRWAGLWGRLVLGGCGMRVQVEQRVPLDPEQPYVFVANHQNALDILALAGYLPAPFGFVAKAELARVPFLGFAIRQSASLFIDRSDPRRSLESMQRAGRRIRDGTSVLIFAEGARSYGASLLPFKKGAFILAVEAGVPLVPVTLVDAYRLLDERRYAARPGTIHMVVGEPLPMAGYRRRDLPAIMEAVKQQMRAVLLPSTPRNSTVAAP